MSYTNTFTTAESPFLIGPESALLNQIFSNISFLRTERILLLHLIFFPKTIDEYLDSFIHSLTIYWHLLCVGYTTVN